LRFVNGITLLGKISDPLLVGRKQRFQSRLAKSQLTLEAAISRDKAYCLIIFIPTIPSLL
jgi:hypothetical protein